MSQDSFFQEQFWNIVPMMYQEDYVSGTATIYKLKTSLKSIDLVIQDEQLIKLKDNKAIKYINLIEVSINLDEQGLTFQNKFGILTVNGDALKSLYDLVITKCMHTNIHSLYKFHQMIHQSAKFQVFEITSKQSGITYAAKRYLKSYNKLELRQEIQLLDDRIQLISEDEEFVYVVIPTLQGQNLENCDLNFEECQFGILKLLHKYHLKNTIVGNLSFTNIILLDKYLNMEILDSTQLKQAEFSFTPNQLSLKDDVYTLGLLLKERYPLQVDHYSKYLLPITERPTVQELLFEGYLVNHFGDKIFYQMLNSKAGEVVPSYGTFSQLESFVFNQMNQIDTFNTIRACMVDSSDESNDDEMKNPYQDWMNQFRQAKYRTQSFEEDSPILSPKIIQNQTKHKSKLSSRQMVLEKLLNENIISQKQFQQFYKEEDFENQDELNEFGLLLQKEIANSSSITTPIQSQNTTCPNTVKINCVNKEALSRVSDLMEELQQELNQNQLEQPYNVNKVQNVRKNLSKLH